MPTPGNILVTDSAWQVWEAPLERLTLALAQVHATEATRLRDEYMTWRRKRGLEPTAAQWTRFYDWEMALMSRDDMPCIGIPEGGE